MVWFHFYDELIMIKVQSVAWHVPGCLCVIFRSLSPSSVEIVLLQPFQSDHYERVKCQNKSRA